MHPPDEYPIYFALRPSSGQAFPGFGKHLSHEVCLSRCNLTCWLAIVDEWEPGNKNRSSLPSARYGCGQQRGNWRRQRSRPMEFRLSEEQQKIRRSVREVCEQYPDEYWRELDRERRYPEEFVSALTEARWLGALIPEEYGGLGLGVVEAS